MRVEIDINVICPGCGCVMTRFADGYISCQTTFCHYYDKKFEKPKVVITEITELEKESE